ncbi:conserved hypothetical protein [Candidatus Caldarchaeum subterraneum]|nr:hypothetical conserved protein [Candidatus Caldarchaeum subterraneum]BAJ47073.1 conserved hypothetical protein [Candidatus Caldarchaeum subterraneum]BAJ48995.1 conserved hypothetical protein [Candidatus Caldarchaeum subterraneum]BAJ51597.1 conserved hypothetical protein [Candidatus Caldarchaeum subterraneum]
MFTLPTVEEIVLTLVLFIWILFVTSFVTRRTYNWMVGRGMAHHVAVYYNRKIIHVLAGAVAAIVVAYYMKSYLPVIVLVAVLAVGNYLPHKRNKLMYWYQVEDNMFEVHFVIMWGLIMGLGFYLGDVRLGLLPILFMSVGDGVTGFVRNMLYRRRTKSWWGNLAMALFCIPVGYLLYGSLGMVAGAAASFIEKFEFGNVDDNITVPLVSFAFLMGLPLLGVTI